MQVPQVFKDAYPPPRQRTEPVITTNDPNWKRNPEKEFLGHRYGQQPLGEVPLPTRPQHEVPEGPIRGECPAIPYGLHPSYGYN